jgi:hypothetical protein
MVLEVAFDVEAFLAVLAILDFGLASSFLALEFFDVADFLSFSSIGSTTFLALGILFPPL